MPTCDCPRDKYVQFSITGAEEHVTYITHRLGCVVGQGLYEGASK